MTSATEPATDPGGNGGRRWSRRRVVLTTIACAVGAIALFFCVRIERKVSADAAFCTTSCHHTNESVNAGSHAIGHENEKCQSCHAVTIGQGLKLYWASITKKESLDKHGAATAKACESCHDKRPAEWRIVQATQGHREHRGAKNVDCLSCHTGRAGAEATEKACIDCHADQRLHKATTPNAETCLSCHNYAATPKHAKEPTTLACTRCHSDQTSLAATNVGADARPLKDVNAHVLHGGVGCQLCHNAHGKKMTPPPGQAVCAKCHQFETFQVGNVENRRGPEEHFKCEGCHKTHAPLKTALDRCVDCHEKNAKGISAAGIGRTTALKHENCASCHVPHTWKAERSGCQQCHKDKAELVATRSPPQHAQCTNCHDVHGPPPTGAVCVSCHAKTKGNHVALAPQRHKDCTSCHNPHAPSPQDTRTSCAKCHGNELAQVAAQGPEAHAKTTCFGCHQPHDNPRPPATLCARCHDDKAKAVATAPPPKHKACTSCHETHRFRVDSPSAPCAKCHGETFANASAGLPAHKGDCKSCHAIHGPPGVAQTACLTCHEKVSHDFKGFNEKHGVCKSCHQPHTPASTAAAKCSTCHEAKVLIATKWPAGSAHAGACNNCHQQHDARNKKPCASCHAQEAQSAMGGKHQCQQCHAPHDVPPGAGKAWWQRCATCHAPKIESAKARGPTHQKCENCHKPHKFAAPSCQSCHQDVTSKGLHATQKHASSCTSCHDPHVKSDTSPAQCRACHTNKMNHEPNAKKCQACHMFK